MAGQGGSTRALAPWGRRALTCASNEETGAYRVIALRDTVGPEPLAGQFYMLSTRERWGGAEGRPYLPRAFSVAACTDAVAGIELVFLSHAVGPGTSRLESIEPGEEVWAVGPLGRPFTPPAALAPDAAGAILVGGGIGIAPLALWRGALSSAGVPARTILGFRDREHSGGLELFECSEVGLASDDGHVGHHGRVTDLLERLLSGNDADSAAVYACGPPAMLEAVRQMTIEIGVPCELALEAPMGCGFGACFGCAVPKADGGYLRLCLDGPVVSADAIETALVPGSPA